MIRIPYTCHEGQGLENLMITGKLKEEKEFEEG